MLLVKNFVAPSAVHGMGLYAAEPIKKGQMVWQIQPLIDVVLARVQVLALPQIARLFMEEYAVCGIDGDYLLSADNARFINHSFQPNVGYSSDLFTIPGFALRDIQENEEILEDYRQYDYSGNHIHFHWQNGEPIECIGCPHVTVEEPK